MKKLLPLAAFISFAASAFSAFAESSSKSTSTETGYQGMAFPWQMDFQPPVTPVMEKLYDLHSFLLVVITVITILVLAVMAYICLRFNRKANPVASKTTHNTKLEIIWTTIPILILVGIAIPSLRLHYFMQNNAETTLTVKAAGYQWYWHYDYPDNGGFGFDSYMLKGNDLKPSDHRQLSVDNRLVVPVDTKVRVLITAADVIHSWSVPAFGVKKDAIPGRLNETWFEATKIGTFYGQCSQLCGVGHGFMPVVVEVVSKEDFAAWVQKKKQDAGLVTGEAPAAKAAPAAKEKSEGVHKKSENLENLAEKNAKLVPAAGKATMTEDTDADAEDASATKQDKE
jgi:cytochrome c oxidase subunit 2